MLILVTTFLFIFLKKAESVTTSLDVSLVYKEDANLLCNIATPVSFYMIDSGITTAISNSSKYVISSTTLTLKTLKKADIQRTYFCNNSNGDRVNFNKKVTPRLYFVDQNTVSAISGYVAKLACYLLVGTENSQTINWTWTNQKGVVLTSNGKYSIETKTDSTELTFNILEISDRGFYYCEAKNSYGSHSRNTFLAVKSNLAPLWPFLGTLGELAILFVILFLIEGYHKKGRLFGSRKTRPIQLTDTKSMESKSNSSAVDMNYDQSTFELTKSRYN